MSEIAPGWYKDPAEPTTQRYWDGEGWVGDPLPLDETPPDQPPAAAPAAPVPAAAPAAPVPVAARPGALPPPAGPAPVAGPPVPAVPPGALPPGALPPGAPPGAIPWYPGMPLPPGYRVVHHYAPARPRPHGLPVAPLGLRFLARLIDFGAVLGLNVVATGWLVYLLVSDYTPLLRAALRQSTPDNLPAVPGRATVLTYLIPLIAMVVWLAYEVPAIAHTGQTLGKRVVGIKVMAQEGEQPIGFARALRRWNPLGLPMLVWACGLGFVLQLIDSISPCLGGPLQLALHDRSAQTVVVRCGRRGHEITPVKATERAGEQ